MNNNLWLNWNNAPLILIHMIRMNNFKILKHNNSKLMQIRIFVKI